MEKVIHDVFISYSRNDYVDEQGNVLPDNILSKIKKALKENDISYWFDEEGIYSGDEFASVLTNGQYSTAREGKHESRGIHQLFSKRQGHSRLCV